MSSALRLISLGFSILLPDSLSACELDEPVQVHHTTQSLLSNDLANGASYSLDGKLGQGYYLRGGLDTFADTEKRRVSAIMPMFIADESYELTNCATWCKLDYRRGL